MVYVNIKDDDTVGYMAIVRLPEENNKYAFFNINKNILKPCRFNSEEEAFSDIYKYIKNGKVKRLTIQSNENHIYDKVNNTYLLDKRTIYGDGIMYFPHIYTDSIPVLTPYSIKENKNG